MIRICTGIGAAALGLGFCAGAAFAVPVTFTASLGIGTISGPNSLGITLADIVVVEVVADNGGGLFSGEWFQSHVISAKATVGSYVATFAPPYFTFDPLFRTDVGGAVTLADFADIDGGNSDTIGGSPTIKASSLFQSDGTTLDFTGSHWSASAPPAVPLPASLALLGGALGLLGLVSRRRAA